MNERPHLEQTVRQDPRYREGLAHMQAARWSKAIESFLLLTREFPDSDLAAHALEEAQFKADLDSRTTVRAKRANAFDVRKWGVRLALVVVLGVLVWQGVPFVTNTVLPYIRLRQLTGQVNDLVAAGNAALKEQQLDAAEGSYTQVVALAGDYAAGNFAAGEGQANPFTRQVSIAEEGLGQIAFQREVRALYDEGVKFYDQSRLREALDQFQQVSHKWPGYEDVDERIAQIQGVVNLEDMLTEGEALRQAGLYVESLAVYREIQSTSLSFRRELVTSRLYELYVAAGRQLMRTWFPDRDTRDVYREAQQYFREALALQPRSEEVAAEQRLVDEYEAAEGIYFEARWAEAVEALDAVYAQAPDYLGGHLAQLLYDALVYRGDELRAEGDTYEAYALYERAAALPVPDITMAQGGMAAIDGLFLPTPTPAPSTPTPRPTARPTARPASGPTAEPTPAPLSTYRGQIVFFADKPGESGVWAMNPDGSGRRYLGNSQELYAQHAQLAATYRYGAGERAFVQRPPNDESAKPQVWRTKAGAEQQLTFQPHYCYDPAWSPDGGRIVFVGQGYQSDLLKISDDIWIINADGSGETNLTPWDKTYEKHPSWSPDGSQIAFWSSAPGPQQIHVMTASGGSVRNISNTSWNEYDPVWVR